MKTIRATVTLDVETNFDDDESTVETLLYCLLEDLNDNGLYTVYDVEGSIKQNTDTAKERSGGNDMQRIN